MIKVGGGNSFLDLNFIMQKAQISEGMTIADLGCGNGSYIFIASEIIGENGYIYAVDILKTVLANIDKRAVSENITNLKTIWSNLEIFNATKIESGTLDVATLVNTLYQSHKRAEIIREAVRMLKKGGILTIVEWKIRSASFGPPVEERVKPEFLKEIAKKIGLVIEDEFEVGRFHYGMIFTKV